MDGLISKK